MDWLGNLVTALRKAATAGVKAFEEERQAQAQGAKPATDAAMQRIEEAADKVRERRDRTPTLPRGIPLPTPSPEDSDE